MADSKIKRNKIDLHVTISPYLKNKIKVLVDTETFTSETDVTTIALTEFLLKMDAEKELDTAFDVLIKMLETPEGQAAFRIVTKREEIKTGDCSDELVYTKKVIFE